MYKFISYLLTQAVQLKIHQRCSFENGI